MDPYPAHFRRSPSLTLVRESRPVIEIRRVFQVEGILHLEHRELQPDLRPYNNNWFPVSDETLFQMQLSDGGNCVVQILYDLPHVR